MALQLSKPSPRVLRRSAHGGCFINISQVNGRPHSASAGDKEQNSPFLKRDVVSSALILEHRNQAMLFCFVHFALQAGDTARVNCE